MVQLIENKKKGVITSSVVDPDPHGIALIWLSCIRINTDLNPDQGRWKLKKINK